MLDECRVGSVNNVAQMVLNVAFSCKEPRTCALIAMTLVVNVHYQQLRCSKGAATEAEMRHGQGYPWVGKSVGVVGRQANAGGVVLTKRELGFC